MTSLVKYDNELFWLHVVYVVFCGVVLIELITSVCVNRSSNVYVSFYNIID